MKNIHDLVYFFKRDAEYRRWLMNLGQRLENMDRLERAKDNTPKVDETQNGLIIEDNVIIL